MNFHNNWRTFLAESQAPLTEEEIALIAEGRIDDATKKYPNVERYVDRLAGYDPSKNNKYLMWMMKQLDSKLRSFAKRDGQPYEMGRPDLDLKLQDSYFGQLLQDTGEIGEAVEEFHKNIQRIKNKDINSYKTLEDLQKVNKELGFSQRQKKKGQKMKALEDTEILIDNDYFYIARPYTVEAAAELGSARATTSWCIARGKCGDNWFTKYTEEGKAFYYVISKHLSEKNDASLQALTIKTQSEYDDPEVIAINNRPNKEIEEAEFYSNITEVVIAGIIPDPAHFEQEWEDLSLEEPTPELIKKVSLELIEEFGAVVGLLASGGDELKVDDIEDINDAEEVYYTISRLLDKIPEWIQYVCGSHGAENPAGPRREDYQEILEEYEKELKHAYISFDDYDESQFAWSGGMSFQLSTDLEWVPDGDNIEDYEEEIIEIFRQKADDNSVYPEEITFDSYDEEIRMDFNPDYNEVEGVDGFKNFCESVVEYDKQHDIILEETIEEIHEQGLVRSEAYRTRLQIFEELPKFRNFESILEKGIIKVFTKFDLDLKGFTKAIKFHELIDSREGHQIAQSEPSVSQRAYLGRLINNVEREIRSPDRGSNNSVIGNDWIAEMAMVFSKASEEAQKQLELPLQEGKKWEPLHRVPSVQLLAPDIKVSPNEKVTGTILFELTKKQPPDYVEDTIRFISWVDQHFNDAMDVLRKSIMQTAELRGKTAKQEEPQLFQQDKPAHTAQVDPDNPDWRPGMPTPPGSGEAIAENKQTTHQIIFEGWRKFLK